MLTVSIRDLLSTDREIIIICMGMTGGHMVQYKSLTSGGVLTCLCRRSGDCERDSNNLFPTSNNLSLNMQAIIASDTAVVYS